MNKNNINNNFTKLEEQLLIQQYDERIKRCVQNFMNRASCGWKDREDLYQEAVMSFLMYIRSHRSAEDVQNRFPYLDIHHAMCLYVFGQQAVSFPKRLNNFRELINSTKSVELKENVIVEFYDNSFTERLLDRMELESCFDSSNELERKILTSKFVGKKNCEIARELGLSDSQVHRMIRKIGQRYLNQNT